MDLLSAVLRKPGASDDKYSRGVLGFITGSVEYPGAAILGVTAAMRTGIGMVRWLGPKSVGQLLLEVRPEVVLQPGRVQAWVLGSGVATNHESEQAKNIIQLFASEGFAVIDAGALDLCDFTTLRLKSVLTPHAREAERLFARLGSPMSRAEIERAPAEAASQLASLTGQTVLLKGSITTVADATGKVLQTPAADPALATAGSGDVLAGVIGALMAANATRVGAGELSIAQLAFAGALLHAEAGSLAAEQGPVVAMDIAEAMRAVVGGHLG